MPRRLGIPCGSSKGYVSGVFWMGSHGPCDESNPRHLAQNHRQLGREGPQRSGVQVPMEQSPEPKCVTLMEWSGEMSQRGWGARWILKGGQDLHTEKRREPQARSMAWAKAVR